MMLGEDQHAALVAALRNQPQYPRGNAAPSAQSIMQNAEALGKGYQAIKEAGKSDAQQYADEFGQYDVDFAKQQAKTPDQGDFMKGLQNKWNGLFGGSNG
jgi:hypothetical protein